MTSHLNYMSSMLGALVGDAAGATLEFCHQDITQQKAQRAMTMPGGGCIKAGPGQITDDGELTLSLWRALNNSDAHNTNDFPYQECLEQYAKWYDSMPFDIGMTCSIAFGLASNFIENNSTNIQKLLRNVLHENKESEANGALMRISALCSWAIKHNIHWKVAVNMAKCDSKLSHPSIVCQEVNAIYVFIIMHLLQGVAPEVVLVLVSDFIKDEIKSEKVHKWFFEESFHIHLIDAKKCIGHVRHAFSLCIYFLRNPEINYEEAIEITLLKGGDTDTNAAIVGGLVACYHSIPEYMLTPVLQFDSTKCNKYKNILGHYRPKEYCVKYVLNIENK